MKANQQCPICFSPLEKREVAPCWDCGDDPKEIAELQNHEHKYNEWEVFPGVKAVLCDFCDADFGSYDPTYFGFRESTGTSFGLDKMRFIREIGNPSITIDAYCPECSRRLAFLKFLVASRKVNQGNVEQSD